MSPAIFSMASTLATVYTELVSGLGSQFPIHGIFGFMPALLLNSSRLHGCWLLTGLHTNFTFFLSWLLNDNKYYFSVLKKIVAILFFAVHLLGTTGYSPVFQYFIFKSDKKVIRQLDNNQYNDADLVQVNVPLNLPYTTNWKDYERYDGEIEFNGQHYNYVKRKILNDTLHLLCIPNQAKTDLYDAKNDYAKQLSDNTPVKKNNETPANKMNPLSEYNHHIAQYRFVAPESILNQQIGSAPAALFNCFIDAPGKPPQTIA